MPAVAALKAREPRLLPVRQTAEEGVKGLLQAGEHILEHVAVDGGVFRELRTDRLQLGFLLRARETETWQRCQAVMHCCRATL